MPSTRHKGSDKSHLTIAESNVRSASLNSKLKLVGAGETCPKDGRISSAPTFQCGLKRRDFTESQNHKATNIAQRRTHNEIFGSSGDSPSQLTNFRLTGRVRLLPNRKNSARQRRALRKGEKIAFGGRGSRRTENFFLLPISTLHLALNQCACRSKSRAQFKFGKNDGKIGSNWWGFNVTETLYIATTLCS